MMILAFIAVAALALFLISRFDPTQQGVQQKFDLKESVWYALNILLQVWSHSGDDSNNNNNAMEYL